MEQLEDGKRVGFQSHDVADASHSVQLATLDTTLAGEMLFAKGTEAADNNVVGEFRVHLDEVATFAKRALASASSSTDAPKPKLVFLDEVGAMQLLSSEIQALFQRTLASSCGCLGTLPPVGLHDLPFVDELRKRDDINVLEVTLENRDSLVDMVCALLYRVLFPKRVASAIAEKAFLSKFYAQELGWRLGAPRRWRSLSKATTGGMR